MSRRYTLKYEYSTDGLTWIDFSDIVDSAQTSLVHNLCTTQFKSAKDSVTFTIPSVTSAVKNQLIEDLLGTDDLHFRMTIPTPVPVYWGDDQVQWGSDDVYWDGSDIGFVGYIDRSSVNLKSYPLPTTLTLTAYDVSWLKLDEKVNQHIVLENKKISEIVHALLGYAGYSYDASTLDAGDDVVIEGFAIDKDDSKTYRNYIDTLLFEAGGYVLDFTPNGYARIFHLPWDDANGPIRTIDNPMNASGIAIKSAWLKEDGVKLKWSSLAWMQNGRLWKDSISRERGDVGGGEEDIVGEWIKMDRYWPDGGELTPSYMDYSTEWLDTPYLLKDTRMQNQDLSVIMAKNVGAVIEALRGGKKKYVFPAPVPPYTSSVGYPIPTSPTDFTDNPYYFTANPMIWAKKAWYLLHNPQWSPVTPNGTENPKGEKWWYLNGTVYTKATETSVVPGRQYYIGATYTAVTPQGTENPAYEGWFVLSGGNYVLTTDVTVQPGTTYYDAPDGRVDLQSFEIYGDVLYRDRINTLSTDGSTNPKEYTSEYIYDATQAQNFLDFYWHFLQTSRFSMSWSEPYLYQDLGDVVEITQKGMTYTQDAVIVARTMQFVNDKTPIVSYTAVGVAVPTLSNGVSYSTVPKGSANNPSYEEISIEQKVEDLEDDVENWDFAIEQSAVPRNDRISWSPNDSDSYTDIKLESLQKGYGLLEYWECDGTSSPLLTYFVGANSKKTSGSTPILRIYKQETCSEIHVTMGSSEPVASAVHSITKVIKIDNQTDYDHDFGVWEPLDDGTKAYIFPDSFTDKNGEEVPPYDGDFYVAKTKFSTTGTQVSTPTGNPNSQGWMERYGAGTPSRPYYYKLTADTTVDLLKTYYTASGQINNAGYAYIRSGASWVEMNITNEANAIRASKLLDDLTAAYANGIQIPASVSNYSMWTWAKNFVAQNAMIQNLFSQAITILSGGYIKGGDRYNSDGTIADWNENGFWFGSNGKLKCNLQSDNNGNTFVGTDVGINTTLGGTPSGNYNTAMGYGAMKYNTTGDKNIAIGYYALASNTIGTDNIAIGYSALAYNTLGVDNVAIGNAALASSNGLYNVAIGYGAMNRNTSGSHNAAIGTEALLSCTTGDYNVALGPEALHNSTTGAKNIALGYLAMSNNSTGGNNICIGYATTTYLATGHNQINLNDAIICLEFNAARQSKNLYSVLNSYFPSNRSVGAMGVFDGQSVAGLSKSNSGISVLGANGYTLATLTSGSAETFTGRTIIAFINPKLTDSDRSSKDCLTT